MSLPLKNQLMLVFLCLKFGRGLFLGDIKDITTELNEQKDQLSTIMIEPLQGEAFRLVVSNSKNKDSQFVEQLTALWKTSQNE